MSHENPYAPPSAQVADTGPGSNLSGQLASRGKRLAGALLDGVILLPFMAVIFYFSGYWSAAMAGKVTFANTFMITAANSVIYLLLNGYFLMRGQTIAKRILDMRIVSANSGEVLPVWRIWLLRHCIIALSGTIPFVGRVLGLGVLLIFKQNRRCLHDYLAGTIVVNV